MNERRLAERVAYKLIHDVCRLQAGDFVLLSGRRDQLDALLRLEFQALAAGARAAVVIEDEERLRRLLGTLSPAHAANERLARLAVAQAATHVVNLSAAPPDLRGLPPDALQAWNEAAHALQAALRSHLRARIDVALPSRRLAQTLRQPFHPYNDAIWQALDCDYRLMEQRGRRLQAALADAPLLRLSDPRGAELTARLSANGARRDDGVFSADALAATDGCVNLLLPAGTFYAAVAEGSAEGEAIIDAAWLQGRALRHLRARFHHGRIAGLEGAGAAQAEAVLAADGGAALLSRLAIGFNPAVTTLRPYPLDSEASLLAYRRTGAVFLLLGDQQNNDAPGAATWSLGLARAMLEVDGQMLLRSGEFLAP